AAILLSGLTLLAVVALVLALLGLTLLGLALLVLARTLVGIGRVTHDPVIVLGVLLEGFREHPVSRNLGVARQGEILFIDLLRVTSNAPLGAVRIEVLRTRRDVRSPP